MGCKEVFPFKYGMFWVSILSFREVGLDILLQGPLYYQPKQCTIIREIPQNNHRFVLLDPPQYG